MRLARLGPSVQWLAVSQLFGRLDALVYPQRFVVSPAHVGLWIVVYLAQFGSPWSFAGSPSWLWLLVCLARCFWPPTARQYEQDFSFVVAVDWNEVGGVTSPKRTVLQQR
ncbi:unnamed protein product [Dicrocoelium dendriticum]|nr:unnamed protein product [Dicrocoelium dendriticum]